MPEPVESPTFFANISTIHVTLDEVSIEFRRIMKSHKELSEAAKGGTEVPAFTEQDLYGTPAIAKVVLTFLAARALRDNLNSLMANFEQLRKTT
jgi:hypothetical protein